mmetsp:Transcript_150/g.196  ORF Transcript_150/g.196 Transcript_150/m.196 type:complete len:82 (-) Transcript_150:1273-1518(-)
MKILCVQNMLFVRNPSNVRNNLEEKRRNGTVLIRRITKKRIVTLIKIVMFMLVTRHATNQKRRKEAIASEKYLHQNRIQKY